MKKFGTVWRICLVCLVVSMRAAGERIRPESGFRRHMPRKPGGKCRAGMFAGQMTDR